MEQNQPPTVGRKQTYELNELAKEESWRLFRILGELVEGFDHLANIEPAVTIYGSARVKPGSEVYEKTTEIARRLGEKGFSIVTGGGPGVMEAANKGAKEAGVRSVGLNISLPEEQKVNPYTDISLTFHHFFIRKVMLVKYATAFVLMPGGIGTLDELTEVLCLIQTGKIRPFPVILFDSNYWQGFVQWIKDSVYGGGYISREDIDLIRITDDPAELSEIVETWFIRHIASGRAMIA